MSAKITYLTPPLGCPFCGSAAKWSHNPTGSMPAFTNGISHVHQWQSSLSCTGCRLPHCSGFGKVQWEGGNASAQQYAMKRALEQWNKRAPVDAMLHLLHAA